MTVLVTGGAGFVGSAVAHRLLDAGREVVLLDNFHAYYDPAHKRRNAARLLMRPGVTLVEGDVRDAALLNTLMPQHGVVQVVHMAAMPGVRESVRQPQLYYDVNLHGTLAVLEAARTHGVQQVVMASTSSVYGATTRLPFQEDDAADRPLAPYPASKRAAEVAAHTFAHLYGLSITVLRLFNVYGPAGRPDMMPLRLMRAVMDRQPVTVYTDRELLRDWTYIDDTVRGVLAALDHPFRYEVINLGLGAPVSLSDFIRTIEAISGRSVPQTAATSPLSEPPVTYCDNSKARALLGFTPTTPLQVGLQHTWDWFCEAWAQEGHTA